MASINVQKGSRVAAGMTHTLCCSVRATSWDSFTFQVAGMMTSTCRGTKHGTPSQEVNPIPKRNIAKLHSQVHT